MAETASTMELHISFLGPSECGKTTLLTSFYGNTSRLRFEKENGYTIRLTGELAETHRLNAQYSALQSGAFPDATSSFHRHTFEMKIDGFKDPAYRLVWSDFPGGWLTQSAADAEEAEMRKQKLLDLANSDVAFLLFDGRDIAVRGVAATKSILALYRGFVEKIGADSSLRVPKMWVLAMTKADLWFPRSAKDFEQHLKAEASDELAELRHAIEKLMGRDGPVQPELGFMLLSAATADDGRQDMSKALGLTALGPIALIRWVRELVAQQASRTKGEKKWYQIGRFLSLLADSLKHAPEVLALLGPRAKLIGVGLKALLKVSRLEDWLKGKSEDLRKEFDAHVKKRDLAAATVTKMAEELARARAQGLLAGVIENPAGDPGPGASS